jgi:hypothetical protein
MQADQQSEIPVERLPTPESLVTDESEAEPKRLLKADRTPAKKAIPDKPNTIQTPRSGPSFIERLQANASPQYSKTFKGKARSSVSTSIVSYVRYE